LLGKYLPGGADEARERESKAELRHRNHQVDDMSSELAHGCLGQFSIVSNTQLPRTFDQFCCRVSLDETAQNQAEW
jgi:hypothetical protein